MKKLLVKIWIMTQIFGMMLTMFFALYIPSMYLNFKLLESMYLNFKLLEILIDDILLASLIVFVLIAFGLLFICFAIAGRILFYYNDLFEWDKKWKLC